jgi:hypothetical protein
MIKIFSHRKCKLIFLSVKNCIKPILWCSINRVARFFLFQTYQNGKNIPNDHKLYQNAVSYTKWPKYIPNCHKSNNIFYSKALQILPNLVFLNKPSGNPGINKKNHLIFVKHDSFIFDNNLERVLLPTCVCEIVY